MLFAISGQGTHFAAAEVEVMRDLDLRSELNHEWMGVFSAQVRVPDEALLVSFLSQGHDGWPPAMALGVASLAVRQAGPDRALRPAPVLHPYSGN